MLSPVFFKKSFPNEEINFAEIQSSRSEREATRVQIDSVAGENFLLEKSRLRRCREWTLVPLVRLLSVEPLDAEVWQAGRGVRPVSSWPRSGGAGGARTARPRACARRGARGVRLC